MEVVDFGPAFRVGFEGSERGHVLLIHLRSFKFSPVITKCGSKVIAPQCRSNWPAPYFVSFAALGVRFSCSPFAC